MKSNTVITIMKKELKRFFSDRRMVFTTVLMPGILIFVMYYFMGNAMSEQFTVEDDYKYKVSFVNMPDSIENVIEESEFPIEMHDETDSDLNNDECLDLIKDGERDLYMVFPEKFDETIADELKGGYKSEVPQLEIYYNSAETNSNKAYYSMTELLDSYEASMSNLFDVNNSADVSYDLAGEDESMGKMLASMLPMLLVVFLFSACVSVGPESIAGEKERGTIATMLITPAKRSHLALGKVLALSIIAVMSGISSTLGTMLSLPQLLSLEGDVNVNVYGVSDYLCLGMVVLPTVLLMVAVISIISAFAKSIKEAQTYVTPCMILVVLAGVSGMFGDGAQSDMLYYLIPIYNSVQSMCEIFSFQIDKIHILITILSDIVYTGLGVFVLTRMFNSERIMFNR